MMAIIPLPPILFFVAISTTYAAFSYAYYGWGHCCWIAPLLLARLAINLTPRKSSALFGLYAMLCWMAISWWLAVGVNSMNASSAFAGPLVVVTLSFLSSIPYWIAGYLFGRMKLFSSCGMRPLTAAALLNLLVELWPARLPGTLGHCLYQSTNLIQVVELGGTGILSFVVYATGFSIIAALYSSRERRLMGLAIALMPLLCTAIYGSNRMAFWTSFIEDSKKVNISMVQPNLPIEHVESPGSGDKSLDTLLLQTKQLLRDESRQDLIVWPEIPIYFSPHNIAASREALDTLLQGTKTPLILNADMFTSDLVFGRVPFYNAVQLFQGSGEIRGQYLKMILVPFGEYLPFENWMTGPEWERVLSGFRRYVPGNQVTVLNPLPGIIAGTPVCLEALHTEQVSAMVNAGANVLVNPANDAYFGTTRGAEIDFAMTVFRTVEYRIPMVRVSNSGISAFIDQRGAIEESSKITPFTADVRTLSVSPSSEVRLMPPKVWGLIFMCGIFVLGILKASKDRVI